MRLVHCASIVTHACVRVGVMAQVAAAAGAMDHAVAPPGGSGAGQPGRRQETEEERRIRKERQRAKEKARLGGGGGGGGGHRSGGGGGGKDPKRQSGGSKPAASRVGGETNRLKRETAFLCPIEFKNDLPPVPVDWKFLRVPVDHDSFTRYSHLSLDEELRKDVSLSADLGITLDPLLLKQYQVPKERPPMDPEDAALLEDTEKERPRTGILSDKLKKSKIKRPDLSKALWLMNTQYISSMTLPEHLGRSEKEWAKQKQRDEEAAGWRDPKEVQVEAIQNSFAAAQRTPVHATNPELHPVEIMPVLPDFERWPGSYVHFVYDEDPAINIKSIADVDDAAKKSAIARSVVKPYSVAGVGADGHTEKFVALMLPVKPSEPPKSVGEDEPEEYEWIREYQYRLQQTADAGLGTMCFFFDHEKCEVSYVELNTKLNMSKRSKHAKGLTEGMEWRPSKVTVKRVAPDEDEERRRANVRARLEDPVAAEAAEAAEEAAAAAAADVATQGEAGAADVMDED